MTDPVEFTSTTPRFGLPLLFAGQAQKEFFVNEAYRLLDFLLHPVVEGESNVPPASPVEGEAWIVGANAQGVWLGHEDDIAAYVGEQWLFASPAIGMRVHSKANNQYSVFNAGWQTPSNPTAPSGGATIDAEARATISELIETLREGGFLPQS